MKRKLIKRNKAFLSKCIKDAKGWPLYLFLYDKYSKNVSYGNAVLQEAQKGIIYETGPH